MYSVFFMPYLNQAGYTYDNEFTMRVCVSVFLDAVLRAYSDANSSILIIIRMLTNFVPERSCQITLNEKDIVPNWVAFSSKILHLFGGALKLNVL